MSSRTNDTPGVTDALATSAAQADNVMRAIVERLGTEAAAHEDALALEARRLAAKYGPDSQQAAAAGLNLEVQRRRRAEIAVRLARLDLRAPDVPADACVIYGRALDASGVGVKGLTVAAVDVNSKTIAQTNTNKDGVFELSVQTGGAPSPLAVSGDEGGDPAAATGVMLRLQVSEQEKLLTRDPEPSLAVAGRRAYREFVVSTSDEPLPDAGDAGSANPSQRKKRATTRATGKSPKRPQRGRK